MDTKKYSNEKGLEFREPIKVRRGGYGKKDKLLRYSIQVSYLGILRREGLLTDEEYEKCMSSLKGDYGIVSDILVG